MSKMNWKKVIGWAVVALVVIGVVGTNMYQSQNKSSKTTLVAMLPLSGVASHIGQDEQIGLQTALEASETKDVDLIFEDTEAKADLAVQALHRHLNINDNRFFYTSTTAVVNASIPTVKQNGKDSLLFTICTKPDVTTEYPYAFRIYPTSADEARLFANIIKDKNYKKVAVLFLQSPTSEGMVNILNQEFQGTDTKIVFKDFFSDQEQNFRILLLKVQKEKPDVLLLAGYARNYQSILRQLYEMDYNVPVIGNIGMLQMEFPEEEKIAYMKNVTFSAPAFYFNQNNPEVKVLAEALQKKGKQLNYEAAYAYDTMKMFIQAVEKATEKTPAGITSAMMSLSPYQGITGEIRLNENRDSILKLYPAQYNGSIVPEGK